LTTVSVTCGAGFIGSNYVNRLFREQPEQWIVVVDALTYAGSLDNVVIEVRESPRFRFVHGSVNDPTLMRELVRQADLIVHFAAETHVARSLEDDRIFFETDVMGTQAVLNAVMRWGDHIDRFVHISSSEVYGTAVREPMDEDHPLNPTSPYAAAKAGADRLVYSYAQTYDVPAVIVRPFNNYGPGQHLEKVVPRFISSALLGEALTIHGDGDASRDWIHVDDTIRGIRAVIEAPLQHVRGQAFNLGTGRDVSVLEIGKKILTLAGQPQDRLEFMDDRIGQVVRHIAATDKATDVLGFRATVDLDAGLERTFRWYTEHPEWWKKMLEFRRVKVELRGRMIWY